jgi:hypothetical protein
MRRLGRFWLFLAVFFACAAGLGCSRVREEPTYDVSGTVTIDGAPLADGFINFESETPDGQPPGSAQITKGNYAAKSRAGKKKVTITSNKPTGEKDSGGFDITANWLPAKYNSSTTLKAEITATGPNKIDFALKR